MKADTAGVVSLLMQQPRALEKHARLLVTMRKRILGQRPAVGTCGAMLNTVLKQVMFNNSNCKLVLCGFLF